MNIPTQPSSFLWRYCLAYKKSYITMLLCILVWAINESLFPYFTKLMVDIISSDQLTQNDKTDLWTTFKLPILGSIITWGAMEISMRIYGLLEVFMYPRFKANIRHSVFDYVKGQSLEFFTKNLSGKLSAKVADIPRTSEDIMNQMMWSVFAPALVLTISIIVVAQTSIIFSLLIIVWCSAHMGVTFYYLPNIRQKVTQHYECIASLNGEINDLVANATAMRLFGHFDHETTRLQQFQETEIKFSKKAGLYQQKVNLIRGILTLIFIFTTSFCLLLGWQKGWLSPGDFPMVAMTSFSLIGMIWNSSLMFVGMFQDVGVLNGALSLLKVPHAIVDAKDALPMRIECGHIEFKSITFGFKTDKSLFKNLSLNIAPKEKIGLVGFSGSGKTTFVNLLLREYNLSSGQILIDGQDIAGVTCQSLHHQISVIPQDALLFHRSVMENIRYGRLTATDEQVKQAARQAHCDEFIQNLDHGYDTVVGERGSLLSGGQRQRLAIARSILKDAHILILDEATSALDSITENNIHDSLFELMKNCTSITIAHRLSTLKMMDRILVFDKGVIVEEGTHEALLTKGGHFAHLWSLQKQGFIPDKIDDDNVIKE